MHAVMPVVGRRGREGRSLGGGCRLAISSLTESSMFFGRNDCAESWATSRDDSVSSLLVL